MVAGVPLGFQAIDALLAMGLGFITALVYGVLRGVLRGRLGLALADGAGLVLAVFLLQSYCAGRGYAGIPRWYTALALAAGFWAVRTLLLTGMLRLFHRLGRWLFRPVRLAAEAGVRILRTFFAKIGRKPGKSLKKARLKSKKTLRCPLHKNKKVLYNSL